MIRAAVITVSDSVVAGTREDRSGLEVERRVREFGWEIALRRVVSDDRQNIASILSSLADSGEADIILTTGGTGVALRDVTPEAVRDVADREVPGFGELMRAEGRKSTKFAPLSRGGAFTRGRVLIITLPGSPKGAVQSLDAVADLIPHAINLLQGHTEHDTKPAPD